MLALLFAAALSCPSDQVIGLDLPAWKAALQKDRPGSDEQHAEMAALRMKTVPEGNDSEADCSDKPVVEGVDVFDANLTGEHDKLVQVRFRMCKGKPEEWVSLRIAVLAPLPEQRFCMLAGEDLSADRAVKELPCGAKLPVTVAFKEMTQKGRKVVEARDQSGACPGMTQAKLALYEAQGWSLEKIFDTALVASNGLASGQVLVQKYRLTLGTELPKTIRVERCIEADCDVIGDFAYAKPAGKYLAK